jgi:hypothetical protein
VYVPEAQLDDDAVPDRVGLARTLGIGCGLATAGLSWAVALGCIALR